MIIPEEFQFSSKDESRTVMTAWIREHYSGLLGAKINLIDLPNGLELIEAEVKAMLARTRRENIRLVKAA
jgi:hypothetical protein